MNTTEAQAKSSDSRPTTSSVLFRGQYIWRSGNGTASAMVPLVFSIIFISVAVTVLMNRGDSFERIVAYAFVMGGTFFGGLGLLAACFWICDKHDGVEVTEDGITYRNRFKSWNEIRKFYGTRYRNGVCLGYLTRKRVQFGSGSLPTTPYLKEAEYELLAQALQRRIADRFPHVDVVPYAIEDTGGS